jgi:membrane-associated phospholipid phosphatase
MDGIWLIEVNLILFFQSLGSWLAAPMKLLSFLGTEEFILLIPPAVYWCVDPKIGFRLGVIIMSSNSLNSLLKLAFHSPRPYWFDPRVQALASEPSFGMPSGHAQNSAAIWGFFASVIRRPWAVIAAVVLVFLIGFSRLYLGVHFISDVAVGWIIGGLLLWGFLRLEKPVGKWLSTKSLGQIIVWVLISAFAYLFLTLLIVYSLSAGQIPDAGVANVMQKGADLPAPLDINGAFTIAGSWIGLACGYAWLVRSGRLFSGSGSWIVRLARYGIGLIGVLILYSGLGSLFPRTADILGYSLRLLRYILIGVWMSALAPLVFAKLKLTVKKEPK